MLIVCDAPLQQLPLTVFARVVIYGMDDGHRPDKLEYGIRFGCGMIFGFIFGGWLFGKGLFLVIKSFPEALAAAIICGLLAMWLGDRFWFSL